MGYKLNSKLLILGGIIKLDREVRRKTANV